MTEQAFERYPALASWVERLGNTPGIMPLGDWMVFVGALNRALNAARAEGAEPPPSYDGSKSLGERLTDAFEAVAAAIGDPNPMPWHTLEADDQATLEQVALNFAARLSDRGEGLGGPHEPAVPGYRAPSADAAEPGDEERAGQPLTPEGFVREWSKRGSKNLIPIPRWETPYQEAGLIEQARRLGYIEIGRDVACTITLRAKGAALLPLPATPSDTGKASG